jgi:hypothetical protein
LLQLGEVLQKKKLAIDHRGRPLPMLPDGEPIAELERV